MNDKPVRIGGASGFWGDTPMAAAQLLEKGNVDYLTFDYLAELTMSILSRARAKDPALGYATDFVHETMRAILPQLAKRGVKVLSNAGGVNPAGCAAAIRAIAAEQGIDLKIAVVEGDDLMPRLDDLREGDVRDLHSHVALPAAVMSANAYLGARPIVAALAAGAQVVITGRCVDSALPLAALIHEFGWGADDYDRLSGGSLAGHLIECGPQGVGGLFTDWEDVPGWEDMGYPIIEASADGSFVITKPNGTGGLVTPASVAEQMLYEIGDPAAYLLPDVTCDFTAVRMRQAGPDRVRVEGARGNPPTDSYKISATHADGWRSQVNITLIGPRSDHKAARVAEAILARSRRLMAAKGIADYRLVHSEILGTEAVYGPNSCVATSREVVLRLVVEHDNPKALDIFAREIAPGGTSWTPGLVSIGGGRPKPTPVIKQFSFLWPKQNVDPGVRVDGAPVAAGTGPSTDARHHEATRYEVLTTAAPGDGATIEVALGQIAHGRSGDKGNSVNIGLIAREERWLPVIAEQVTAGRVAEYFAHLVDGPVTRFDVPGIGGFNFLLLSALAGGGMASPRIDPLGKAFAQMLLDLPVRIPA